MKKKIKSLKLLKIYFNYCFSIKTLIILIVSLCLTTIAIYLLSSFDESMEYYLSNYKYIHEAYLNQSILIVEIINAFIIASIVNQVTVSQINFDSMFVSYIDRKRISLIKIISVFMFISLYIILEIIIISAIGFFEFPYYAYCSNGLMLMYYFILMAIIEASIAFLISIVINNNFSMILSFIIFIMLSFAKGNIVTKIDNYELLIPLFNYSDYKYQIPYIGLIISILCFTTFSIIYNNKNIKIT